MSAAYTFQGRDSVEPGDVIGREKTLAELSVPAGSYVVIAKFDVAVDAARSDDLNPRISTYVLTFAGATDKSMCHLLQGGSDTLMLMVAASHSVSDALRTGGGGTLRATARLSCIQTAFRCEIKSISMTAIPVDGVERVTR